MKDGFGSVWRRRPGPAASRKSGTAFEEDAAGAGPTAGPIVPQRIDLRETIGSAALAFRGYDVSNLGRSRELLDHPVYGSTVELILREASEITTETLKRKTDLAGYIRAGAATSLEDFPLDVSVIVGMELAQLQLLDEFFGVPTREAKLSFGYSIGELSALVHGGSFHLDELLPVPLALADDCAGLALDTKMAVLFTRAPVLPEEDVDRLCLAVSGEGNGLVAPSSFLSPNTALLLGQRDTIDRVEALLPDYITGKVFLRRNPNRWPPLHTPIVRTRNIPNRTATALYAIPGARPSPRPPVISCVTGQRYDELLSVRETLIEWTERPQRLWDVIDATLSAGVESVIHVGPAPNLVPATFARLSNNVKKSFGNRYFGGIVTSMHRHAWLAALLPHRAALLRAPSVSQIILEDWLLENAPLAGKGSLTRVTHVEHAR